MLSRGSRTLESWVRRALLPGVVLAMLLGLTTAEAATRERWDTRVFSRVPSPGFPAYAYVHPNGRVYAATYANPQAPATASRVFEWDRRGTLLRSWKVPGQTVDGEPGVQVASSDAKGRLVLLERSESRILKLNTRNGRFTRYAKLPDLPTCGIETEGCTPNLIDKPAIPNYAAWGPGGVLYVSDYGQAVIWKVPAGGGRNPEPWFTDRRLDGTEFGTAGLVLAPDRKSLLLTQQSSARLGELSVTQGKLYRLPLVKGQPGELETVWESLPGDLPDGFGIARSGRIYIANAGLSAQLVVIDEDGTELERFPETPGTGENGSAIPFDTPSNATFLGKRLMVANQSFFGDTSHHALLDVYVGERGVPTFLPKR